MLSESYLRLKQQLVTALNCQRPKTVVGTLGAVGFVFRALLFKERMNFQASPGLIPDHMEPLLVSVANRQPPRPPPRPSPPSLRYSASETEYLSSQLIDSYPSGAARWFSSYPLHI